ASERIQNAFARAGEAGAMIETGDADAALDWAGRIFDRETRPASVIVALLQDAFEQLIHDQRFTHHLFGRGCVAGVEEVSSPQFQRIDAEGGGDFIHVAFERENSLRRAEAAK